MDHVVCNSLAVCLGINMACCKWIRMTRHHIASDEFWHSFSVT